MRAALLSTLALAACQGELPRDAALYFASLRPTVIDPIDDVDTAAPGLQIDVRVQLTDRRTLSYGFVVVNGIEFHDARERDARSALVRVTLPPGNTEGVGVELAAHAVDSEGDSYTAQALVTIVYEGSSAKRDDAAGGVFDAIIEHHISIAIDDADGDGFVEREDDLDPTTDAIEIAVHVDASVAAGELEIVDVFSGPFLVGVPTVIALPAGEHDVLLAAHTDAIASELRIAVDTDAPTVSVSFPRDGAVLSAASDVSDAEGIQLGVVLAVHGEGVKRVDLQIGEERRHCQTAGTLCSMSMTVANGPHTISAIARDEAGNATEMEPIQIEVLP